MFGFRGDGKGLAVFAVLLGLSTPAQAGDERAVYASLGEVTRAPIGRVRCLCSRLLTRGRMTS